MTDRTQIEKWNQRYREGHDDLPVPLPFFVDVVSRLAPGRALDLACGLGRHSLWLREHGWNVTAIDGSEVALESLRIADPRLTTIVADIEAPDFRIPGSDYDLIVDTFFLHRPLFPQIASALRPGGVAVLAFHLTGSFGLPADETEALYPGWARIHYLLHSEPPTSEIAFQKPSITQSPINK